MVEVETLLMILLQNGKMLQQKMKWIFWIFFFQFWIFYNFREIQRPNRSRLCYKMRLYCYSQLVQEWIDTAVSETLSDAFGS